MAYINLLPWREEAQKAKQKEFYTLLAAIALGTLFLVFLVNQFYQLRLDGQETRNQYLKHEINLLDKQISEIRTLNAKKAALQKRIDVVKQLQRSRNVGTQVLDEIAKIVPNGVYLTKLEKQGNSILLLGKSESNNHLANMMREIESSDLFTHAVLESISANDAESKLLSDFKMQLKIKGLTEGDDVKTDKKGGK